MSYTAIIILELDSTFSHLTVKFVILFMCWLLDSLMQELALNILEMGVTATVQCIMQLGFTVVCDYVLKFDWYCFQVVTVWTRRSCQAVSPTAWERGYIIRLIDAHTSLLSNQSTDTVQWPFNSRFGNFPQVLTPEISPLRPWISWQPCCHGFYFGRSCLRRPKSIFSIEDVENAGVAEEHSWKMFADSDATIATYIGHKYIYMQ